MTRIGIIGAGAFGTALGASLANAGNAVTLLARDADQVTQINQTHINEKYLPSIPLPKTLGASTEFSDITDAETILLVTPAQTLRQTLITNDVKSLTCPLILCSKGIEKETGLLQSQIANEQIDLERLAVLSGPGFATELAMGKPTALTLGAFNATLGTSLQQQLSTPTMRLYLSDDPQGVQLGGALKNVFAIACGLVVAANLGESARSALITRGFAELTRLATAMGATTETLLGLSGLGDLTLTCTSEQSRNFTHGLKLGAQNHINGSITVEGVSTAQATVQLAQKMGVDMPIAQSVAAVLAGKLTITEALNLLMTRPLKHEAR